MHLGVGSMWGLDLCSACLFLSCLFLPHPVFVLENNGVISLFEKLIVELIVFYSS